MGIATRIPHGGELAGVACPELPRTAKFRLAVMDFHFKKSGRVSANGKPNAALTCRRFGIQRSAFCRWLKRYGKHRLQSLENRSRAPKRKRQASYSWRLVQAVRKIRKENPTHSAKKIRPILLRDKALALAGVAVPSVAAIGRLIKREGMFYRVDTARRRKRPRKGPSAALRKRKPYGLKADGARKIIESGMKHICLLGQKRYAFCAIDAVSKDAVVHVAKSPSSFGAKAAAQKAVARFGKDACFVNDNGPENMGRLDEYLMEEEITQYFARPRTPKDKPFVERFIGTLQKECLDYHYEPMNVSELSETIDAWLDNAIITGRMNRLAS